MKNSIYCLMVLIGMASCQQNANNTIADQSLDSTSKSTQEINFKSDTITTVFRQYLSLKDALVNSDVEAAATAAETLSTSLHKIDGCGITANVADKISRNSDLKQQRQQFIILS